MKILLIEDDLQITEVIVKYFGERGEELTVVTDGGEALRLAENGAADCSVVLLDIMLPNADGFAVCRALRRTSDIPIIFITARGREEDILHGYDLGCDDYIVKPFLLSALYAKCRAIVKRTERTDSLLTCGAVTIDTRRLVCFTDGREVELTQKEFTLLRCLMAHQGWVMRRDTLLDRVWGSDSFVIDRAVDNQIKRLRKALGSAGGQIHTVIGRGYKLLDK